ncbi:YdcF family protein [Oricola sp.]|uniref:YdcF family protein n=1 Tax=Oricola sp. TaxID=1979950 RepID=UPI003BAD260A
MNAPLEPDASDVAAAEILWEYHCIYETPRPADAIIGLGSYDLRVADWCAELQLAGFAPVIVFTGAAGNWTKGLYETSEAEAFAERAIAAGVPSEAILLEERATNIGENIRFTKAMCAGMRTVIAVTKPQTQRRCLATIEQQWPAIDAIVSAPLHGFEQQPTERHGMADLISEMVGDVWRMKAYPQMGFQTEQPVPAEVAKAGRQLICRGYTGNLPDGAEF